MRGIIATYLFLTLCSMSNPGHSQDFNGTESIKVPFSAEVWVFDQRSDESRKSADVTISRQGVRVRTTQRLAGRDENTLFIQNFDSGKSWLVRPSNRTFARLPDPPEEDSEEHNQPNDIEGIMSTRPCASSPDSPVEAVKTGTSSHEGEAVEVWKCTLGDLQVKQLYSPSLSLVVHERLSNSQGVELRRIRVISDQAILFQPSENHAEIPLEELVSGSPTLPSYGEP